jgi:hypothetical protein
MRDYYINYKKLFLRKTFFCNLKDEKGFIILNHKTKLVKTFLVKKSTLNFSKLDQLVNVNNIFSSLLNGLAYTKRVREAPA